MIPFIGLALYAEGPTDHRFLEGVTRRTVIDAFVRQGIVVEVPEVQRLTIDAGIQGRADRIVNGAQAEQGAFHILFIHADADGDAQRARNERIDPGAHRVDAQIGTAGRATVPVVPVRATEAWALADGDALRRVLSTTRSDAELGLPGLNELERLPDPKAMLDGVVNAAHTLRRGRRRRKGAYYLDELAEQVGLAALRGLPAFQAFESDVEAALRHIGHPIP